MSSARDLGKGTVKAWAVLALAFASGCSSPTEAGDPLVVRGTVVSGGVVLDGAVVTLRGLANLLGPGPEASARSDAEGRFQVRMVHARCGSTLSFDAEYAGYDFSEATGFDGSSCPGVVEGVVVRMEPVVGPNAEAARTR